MIKNKMEKPIKLDKVFRVYSGKFHCCYCGCSGSYLYPDNRTTIEERKNLPKVKRIVNKLNKNISKVVYLKGTDEDIYTLTIGKHDWTVYCKPYSNLDFLEEKYEERLKKKTLDKSR